MTGVTVVSGSNTSASSFQQRRTLMRLAMSAIEQPAARSGRMTLRVPPVTMSATSAMKCTPQNTMNSAVVSAASRDSLSESPVKSAC